MLAHVLAERTGTAKIGWIANLANHGVVRHSQLLRRQVAGQREHRFTETLHELKCRTTPRVVVSLMQPIARSGARTKGRNSWQTRARETDGRQEIVTGPFGFEGRSCRGDQVSDKRRSLAGFCQTIMVGSAKEESLDHIARLGALD